MSREPSAHTSPARPPVVVSCSYPWCPSAIAMPPGTPENAQQLRLDIAGWGGGLASPVCPHRAGHHEPVQEPARKPPPMQLWVAVCAWMLLVKTCGLVLLTLHGTTLAWILTAVLATACWWTFVWLTRRDTR